MPNKAESLPQQRKADQKIRSSEDIVPQPVEYLYTRLAAGTPEDPADIYQENQTLRLMVEDFLLDRLNHVESLTEDQKHHAISVLTAYFGYRKGGAA